MDDAIELRGDVEHAGEAVIVNFPNGGGVVSIRAGDCRITEQGVEVAVGTRIAIHAAPRRDGEPDLDSYAEMTGGSGDSYACVGAIPGLNIFGAFIDCTTGEILGKCVQNFPCTPMK